MRKEFPTDIDPAQVPAFPTLTIEVQRTSDPEPRFQAILGGLTVSEHDTDADAYDAAIDAAAAKVVERGWDAQRVNAVSADGTRFRMVVAANGGCVTVDQTGARPAGRKRRSKAMTLGIAGTLAVGILGVGTIAGITLSRAHKAAPTPTSSSATPTPTPTAQPVELPGYAPAGASTHAHWAAPANGGLVVSTKDKVATLAKQKNDTVLQLLDPSTGQPTQQWKVPSSARGPWLAYVGRTQAIVVLAGDQLLWWDASKPADQPTSWTLPVKSMTMNHQHGCTWLSTSNKYELYALGADAPARRVLPAGAEVKGCTYSDPVVADTLGQQWTLDDKAATLTPNPIKLAPPAAGAKLTRILSATPSLTVALWTPAGTPPSNARYLIGIHNGAKVQASVPLAADPGNIVATASDAATILTERAYIKTSTPAAAAPLPFTAAAMVEQPTLAARPGAAAPLVVYGATSKEAIAYTPAANLAASPTLREPRAGSPLAPIASINGRLLVVTNDIVYSLENS